MSSRYVCCVQQALHIRQTVADKSRGMRHRVVHVHGVTTRSHGARATPWAGTHALVQPRPVNIAVNHGIVAREDGRVLAQVTMGDRRSAAAAAGATHNHPSLPPACSTLSFRPAQILCEHGHRSHGFRSRSVHWRRLPVRLAIRRAGCIRGVGEFPHRICNPRVARPRVCTLCAACLIAAAVGRRVCPRLTRHSDGLGVTALRRHTHRRSAPASHWRQAGCPALLRLILSDCITSNPMPGAPPPAWHCRRRATHRRELTVAAAQRNEKRQHAGLVTPALALKLRN